MIKNIFNNKKGHVQKLILIILVAFAILLIPIGIYASENTTTVDDISEQPLDETVDDIVVEEPLIEEEIVSNETEVGKPCGGELSRNREQYPHRSCRSLFNRSNTTIIQSNQKK